ncbi:hypothetical protein J6590_053867 [Homalodisca vitripennis]|nr:hypothetical protein J6590_053867 [Homalodisca vitripennis]
MCNNSQGHERVQWAKHVNYCLACCGRHRPNDYYNTSKYLSSRLKRYSVLITRVYKNATGYHELRTHAAGLNEEWNIKTILEKGCEQWSGQAIQRHSLVLLCYVYRDSQLLHKIFL